MLEVADILRLYGDGYLQKVGHAMLPSQRRAFADILHCHTQAMGGHVFQCSQCGHQHYVYHSCRNRSCPKCHKNDTAAWLQDRRQELLNTHYYHLVFTVPQQWRSVVRLHQKRLYALLMKTAAQAVIKLAADPHYIGGLVAVMCILHTWSRNLAFHPHVHCLVPAGGISADKQNWLPARKNYLVPVKALSRLFRGMFTEKVRKALPDIDLPASTQLKDWVLYCKAAVQGPDKVLNYLARYVHRVAIPNSRIISIDDGQVSFRYKHTRSLQSRTMTLTAHEFIRRFLQHVPPRGTHKVRYYGLWSPSNQRYLYRMQRLLAPEDDTGKATGPSAQQRCPRCKTGILVWVEHIPRQRRAPPS